MEIQRKYSSNHVMLLEQILFVTLKEIIRFRILPSPIFARAFEMPHDSDGDSIGYSSAAVLTFKQ